MASKVEERIFTAPRLRLWGLGLILAYVIVLAWTFFSERWLIRSDGGPVFADFVWMWVGGQFALSDDPVAAYVYSNFAAAQAPLVEVARGDIPYFHWIYPPTVFFLLAPLATMPNPVAFLVWSAAPPPPVRSTLTAYREFIMREW